MAPSFWRRWPGLARLGIVLACCLISLWIATIPLFVWLPRKAWQGWDGYGAELIYMVFLVLLSLFLTLAGSLTIAPERERQTWESLYITPIGVSALVRAKLVCRLVRCAVPILLMLPFWIAWGFEVLTINGAGPAGKPDALTSLRLTIFLGWLSLRTLGHILPCVTLGMLISALCRKARAALGIACVAVVGYGSAIWALSNIPFPGFAPQTEKGSKLLLWPILPVDWSHYESGGIVSSYWASDVIADTAWIIVLPIVCYWLTVWRCRKQMI